jgi:hypothetical protein
VVRTLGDFISKGLLLAAVTGLAACQAADGTTVAPDTALVNNIMSGLGAVDPNKKEIEYKPRAPLAMPADNTTLPTPSTEVAGAGSQNWPEQRNEDEMNALRDRYKVATDHRGDLKRLTPEQMAGIEIVGVERPASTPELRAASDPDTALGPGKRLSPEQMKIESERFNALKQQQAGTQTAGAALQRQYLIEPPAAYSTPSADAPMPSTEIEVKKEYVKVQRDHETNRLDPKCMAGESKYCN